MAAYYPFHNNPLNTIEQVCQLYGATPRKMGYIVGAGGFVPGYETGTREDPAYFVWTPNVDHDAWCNELIEDGNFIIESKYDPDFNTKMIPKLKEWEHTLRITFARDASDRTFRYLGLYRLSLALSEKLGKAVYCRLSTSLPCLGAR